MPAEQKQLIRASQIAAHKTPSAPESPLSLCYVTDRERRGGVELRMRKILEQLLFRSMWETYFCVRFDSRNGNASIILIHPVLITSPIRGDRRMEKTTRRITRYFMLCISHQIQIIK